jgi:glucose-1-phosphate thymidylyltransferase
MKCLILAGGFATRLYPLTVNRAKALLEFKGKPVITHLLSRVPYDIDVLVSTNKKFEPDFVAWSKTIDRPVEILIEEAMADNQKMGAVTAIDFWIRNKAISDDLMVIAADNYFELDLSQFMRKFNGRNALIAVFDVGDKEKACEIGRACQIGLVIMEENRVVRLDEKPPEATSSIIATGIYILPSRVFPILSDYCREHKRDNLGSFIGHLLGLEPVHAYSFTGAWVDIGDELRKQQQ